MRLIEPSDSPQDVAAAALSSALILFSVASSAAVLRIRHRRRKRLHVLVNPLWPVRLLIPLFASVWSLAELLRSPILRRRLPTPLRQRPDLLCHAYIVASQAIAEPAFLTVLLFLLRASTRPKPASSAAAFAAALAAALLSALPFVTLHALYLSISTWDLRRLGLPPDLYGLIGGAVHFAPAFSAEASRCTYPLFGTVLVAALVTVYVPVFVSASWRVVSVVINRRLRARIYVLSVVVVGALTVQVVALALATFWEATGIEFEWFALAAATAVATLAAAVEAILVVRPIIDALSISEGGEARPDGRRGTCGLRVRDVEQQEDVDDGSPSAR